MRPSEVLARNRNKVLEIIARYPVANPRLFGSVARGDDIEGSDIDLLVDPDFEMTTFVHLGELEEELEGLLGIGVDIVTPNGLLPDVTERIRSELVPL
ncbi:MAG: nucleotidyltransferase domain-containing protein [Rhizobiales bacterium]|nr:nucleotidyltransferase domain-containing protein [Hyphomicrobiales bacterium]